MRSVIRPLRHLSLAILSGLWYATPAPAQPVKLSARVTQPPNYPEPNRLGAGDGISTGHAQAVALLTSGPWISVLTIAEDSTVELTDNGFHLLSGRIQLALAPREIRGKEMTITTRDATLHVHGTMVWAYVTAEETYFAVQSEDTEEERRVTAEVELKRGGGRGVLPRQQEITIRAADVELPVHRPLVPDRLTKLRGAMRTELLYVEAPANSKVELRDVLAMAKGADDPFDPVRREDNLGQDGTPQRVEGKPGKLVRPEKPSRIKAR